MTFCLEAIIGPVRIRDEQTMVRLGHILNAFLDCLLASLHETNKSKKSDKTTQQTIGGGGQGMKELHSVI